MVTNEDITMSDAECYDDIEYLIQCKEDYMDMPIIEDEKEDYPPYVEKLHPRKDYQRKPFWMRIRSNPFKAGYH